MFPRTLYFVATSLFDNPCSRSFKALHFSAKDLFISFRFTRAIFLKKTFDKKLKTFVMHFFTRRKKLSNFCRNVKTKVRENERKSSKGPTILFNLTRSLRYWDSRYREFFCLKECVMLKGPKNLFELLKILRNWVFEFSRINCSIRIKKRQLNLNLL